MRNDGSPSYDAHPTAHGRAADTLGYLIIGLFAHVVQDSAFCGLGCGLEICLPLQPRRSALSEFGLFLVSFDNFRFARHPKNSAPSMVWHRPNRVPTCSITLSVCGSPEPVLRVKTEHRKDLFLLLGKLHEQFKAAPDDL